MNFLRFIGIVVSLAGIFMIIGWALGHNEPLFHPFRDQFLVSAPLLWRGVLVLLVGLLTTMFTHYKLTKKNDE
jgi:drug/metabolite transporter (DMT)-like permease